MCILNMVLHNSFRLWMVMDHKVLIVQDHMVKAKITKKPCVLIKLYICHWTCWTVYMSANAPGQCFVFALLAIYCKKLEGNLITLLCGIVIVRLDVGLQIKSIKAILITFNLQAYNSNNDKQYKKNVAKFCLLLQCGLCKRLSFGG